MSTTGATTVPPAAAIWPLCRLAPPVAWSSAPRMIPIGMTQKMRSAVVTRSSGRSG